MYDPLKPALYAVLMNRIVAIKKAPWKILYDYKLQAGMEDPQLNFSLKDNFTRFCW